MIFYPSHFVKKITAFIGILLFTLPFFVQPGVVLAQNNSQCKILDASFAGYGQVSGVGSFQIPDAAGGPYTSTWFEDDKPPKVIAKIFTQGCSGQTVKISLMSNRAAGSVADLDKREFTLEEDGTLGLLLTAGQELCSELSYTERQPIKDQITAFVSTNRQALFELFQEKDMLDAYTSDWLGIQVGDPWANADEMFEDIKDDFLDEYTDNDIIGGLDSNTSSNTTKYDFYAKMFYESTIVGGVASSVIFVAGGVAATWISGGLAGVATASLVTAGMPGGVANEAATLGVLREFLAPFIASQVTFPAPCDYYIALENENGEISKADNVKQHLRFHCDTTKTVSCKAEFPWKFHKSDTNIGGFNPMDESNPCYDPSQPDLRKPGCQELLAPIPGFGDRVDENLSLGKYINTLLQMVIGFMGIIAVLMIIAAGVKYMTTESFGGKANAKETITNAFLGLLIAVSIFIILRTINPDLLNLDPGIKKVSLGPQDPNVPAGYIVNYSGAGDIVNKYELPEDLKSSLGLYCPGSGGSGAINQIATSFVGDVTYRFGGKGGHIPEGWAWDESDIGRTMTCENNRLCRTYCPIGSICLDCSGYVSHVLQCAGMTTGNLSGTSKIFSQGDSQKINASTSDYANNIINGRELTPGDLLGAPDWHVIIYIGDGKVAESSSDDSGRLKNKGLKITSLESRMSSKKIKYVRFMSN
ncbi:C40 family peptidase [Candidatus Nomurabacteria bacterium]|nr:C40 family peptidase [Candidatus Nomurabacteria bacterium]